MKKRRSALCLTPINAFLSISFDLYVLFHYFCSLTTHNPNDMSTIIYPSPIYGPVHSRRLGLSLGINLMPADGKICTFDCLYCECGFNADHRTTTHHPSREAIATALEAQLQKMHDDGEHPDVLTFAGNGEPTSHPHFPKLSTTRSDCVTAIVRMPRSPYSVTLPLSIVLPYGKHSSRWTTTF